MTNAQATELGELALEIISDYPLYASTSNITYREAIKVAKIFYPNTSEWTEIAGKDGTI